MNDRMFKSNQRIGKYKLVSLLGIGISGEVWSAVSDETNNIVSLKIFRNSSATELQIRHEYETAISMNHPNLLKPFSLEKIEDCWIMEMPLCLGRSVDGIAGYMTENHVWRLIYDVSSALSYLHQKGFGHFDIKPSNILWDEQRYIVTDFGSCQKLEKIQSGNLVTSDDSSYRFDAPELVKGIRTSASDIWSLGATVFNLFMGCYVFNGLGGRVQQEGSSIPYMRKNMPLLSELVVRCLAYDYKLRPSANEIITISKRQLDVLSLTKKERSVKKGEGIIASVGNKTYFWPEDMVEL